MYTGSKKILSVQNTDKVARDGLNVFSEYSRPTGGMRQKAILALDIRIKLLY